MSEPDHKHGDELVEVDGVPMRKYHDVGWLYKDYIIIRCTPVGQSTTGWVAIKPDEGAHQIHGQRLHKVAEAIDTIGQSLLC